MAEFSVGDTVEFVEAFWGVEKGARGTIDHLGEVSEGTGARYLVQVDVGQEDPLLVFDFRVRKIESLNSAKEEFKHRMARRIRRSSDDGLGVDEKLEALGLTDYGRAAPPEGWEAQVRWPDVALRDEDGDQVRLLFNGEAWIISGGYTTITAAQLRAAADYMDEVGE